MLNYQRVFQNSGLGSDYIRTPKKTWSRHHLPCRICSRASNQLMPMGEKWWLRSALEEHGCGFPTATHLPGPSRTIQDPCPELFGFCRWTPFFGNATLALVLGKATRQDLRLKPDGNSATSKKTTGWIGLASLRWVYQSGCLLYCYTSWDNIYNHLYTIHLQEEELWFPDASYSFQCSVAAVVTSEHHPKFKTQVGQNLAKIAVDRLYCTTFYDAKWRPWHVMHRHPFAGVRFPSWLPARQRMAEVCLTFPLSSLIWYLIGLCNSLYIYTYSKHISILYTHIYIYIYIYNYIYICIYIINVYYPANTHNFAGVSHRISHVFCCDLRKLFTVLARQA